MAGKDLSKTADNAADKLSKATDSTSDNLSQELESGRAKRATQTRTRIKQAFVNLIAEKGLDALTVSDITRRAGINRGTFYLHFIDKYDLLEQLEDEITNQLKEILLNKNFQTEIDDIDQVFPPARIQKALEYIVSDFEFVSTIAGPNGDRQLAVKLKSIINELMDAGLAQAGLHVVGNGIYSEAYARELILSRVMAIINMWLENGGKEEPAQLAQMISRSKDQKVEDLLTSL